MEQESRRGHNKSQQEIADAGGSISAQLETLSTCSKSSRNGKTLTPAAKRKRRASGKDESVRKRGKQRTEGEEEYVVEKIIEKQIIAGSLYYLIKWKGYSPETNTWEPLDNLEGCPKLLEEFEKTHTNTGNGNKMKKSRDEVLEKTRKHMKSYGVLEKWPVDKVPLSMEGVITIDGELTYVIKKATRLGGGSLTRVNAVLVHAKSFRKSHPAIVIKYYEQRILWALEDKSYNNKAEAAAQMQLLTNNRGSKIGKGIAKDVNKSLIEEGLNSGRNEPIAGTSKSTAFSRNMHANSKLEMDSEDHPSDSESNSSEDYFEKVNAEMSVDEDDENENFDKFGLPMSVLPDENDEVDPDSSDSD